MIREARPDEHDSIAELIVEAYRTVGDQKLDDYAPELRDVAGRASVCPVLVAADADTGRILGTLTYVPGPDSPLAELERDGEAGFRMFGVAPDGRRRGVGRALVNAAIERARAEGRTAIAIYTRPSMATAHQLYAGLGFVRDPTRDWEFEPGEWLWALSLRLHPD
jgi:GNAT superfamily N-acetyltransferase